MAGKGGFPRPIVYFFVGVILLNLLSSLAEDPGFAEDLPFFLVVGGFILFRIISSRNENKRSPVPMPVPETPPEQPKDLGFKIPTLKGAPKDARTEEQEAQEVEEDLDALRRESYERHLAEKQAREEKMVPKTSHYTSDQLKRLSALSKREGIGEAILLREALDMLLKKYPN